MASYIDPKMAMYWYNHVQEQIKSGLTAPEYAVKNNLPMNSFKNAKSIITLGDNRNSKANRRLIKLAEEFQNCSMTLEGFAKLHDVNPKQIKRAQTYLNYQAIIAEHTGSPKQPMEFKQITVPAATVRIIAPEPEVIEPKNGIDLIIAKGIKVSISPNIDSIKIIKIIELLKDI